MFNKQRLKNYGLWSAVFALVVDLLIYGGVIEVSQSEELKFFAQRLLEMFVLLGILSNPTKPDGKGFNL